MSCHVSKSHTRLVTSGHGKACTPAVAPFSQRPVLELFHLILPVGDAHSGFQVYALGINNRLLISWRASSVDDARKGTLNRSPLDDNSSNNDSALSKQGPGSGLPPLTVAIIQGFLEEVELLKKDANLQPDG